MKKIQSLLGTLALLLALTACQGSGEADAPTVDSNPAAVETETPDPENEVTYEPAYPEEVSEQGLSDTDVAQQETHSHGGEEHSHGDGDHSHGDGEHSHGEGEEHGDH